MAVNLLQDNPLSVLSAFLLFTVPCYFAFYHFLLQNAEERGDTTYLFYWILSWSVIAEIISQAWDALFRDGYSDIQKAKLTRTMFQDFILAVFLLGGSQVLLRAGEFGVGTIGEPVGYLLPIVTIWFSTETKLLTHLNTGTPFHPSWWYKGVVPRYDENELVNLTFSIATALITIILTSYAFVAIGIVMGFESLSYEAESLWKFGAIHGITMIWTSGIWMIIASSGVPAIGKSRFWDFMIIPPLLPANPSSCVTIHIMDLVAGNILLMLAGFWLHDDMDETTTTAVKVSVFTFIVASTLSKVALHMYSSPYVWPVTQMKGGNGWKTD